MPRGSASGSAASRGQSARCVAVPVDDVAAAVLEVLVVSELAAFAVAPMPTAPPTTSSAVAAKAAGVLTLLFRVLMIVLVLSSRGSDTHLRGGQPRDGTATAVLRL
ncbi:hypothetical protein FYJ24_11350 [Actinomycetaceae bacterium WB03_NA08]|uniref:Uncharacterized protein n=1 Tax=Scrofimicrobium canadense TaxID=2652290 RepID=A0A6N7VU88_9ACTO|nr:hypothetical protein [Scrofimicrobium canadense]